jgi:hypothetical protein
MPRPPVNELAPGSFHPVLGVIGPHLICICENGRPVQLCGTTAGRSKAVSKTAARLGSSCTTCLSRKSIMTFDQINAFILDLPIYLLNGLLWLIYALAGSLAALVSAGAAAVIALVVDRAVQQLSGSRPLRQGRGETLATFRTAQILTTRVFAVWFGAQAGMGAPVPWIGAAMWLFGLGAVLVSPTQRFNLFWFVKSGVAVYALAVIGSRLYLNMTSDVSPEAWAGMLGTAQTAFIPVV